MLSKIVQRRGVMLMVIPDGEMQVDGDVIYIKEEASDDGFVGRVIN